ncbi:hypothetical protein [Nocardia sp. NPDC004750]
MAAHLHFVHEYVCEDLFSKYGRFIFEHGRRTVTGLSGYMIEITLFERALKGGILSLIFVDSIWECRRGVWTVFGLLRYLSNVPVRRMALLTSLEAPVEAAMQGVEL